MSDLRISETLIKDRNSPDWEDDFPKGYGHTSIAYLKRCLGFTAAKNGELDAAIYVVSRCAKQGRIQALREKYPNAVLLPILGRNKLPLALAMAIAMPILCSVRIRKGIPRKSLSAMQRLLHKPVFVGYVIEDLAYILVDDIITQGGTISALREFVVVHGGRVVAVVALAYTIGSHSIAPLKRHLVYLTLKFGVRLLCLLQKFGITTTINALTNSQVKYLLRFSSVRNIEKKIAGTTF